MPTSEATLAHFYFDHEEERSNLILLLHGFVPLLVVASDHWRDSWVQSAMVLSREFSNSVETVRIFLDHAFFVDNGCIDIVGININLDQVQCLQQ